MTPIETPPQRALDWCLDIAGGAGQPYRVTRLRGGLAASTHLVEANAGTPASRAVVLRRFVGERTAVWPPIAQEVAALAAVAERTLPYRTPRVLGFDLDGSVCGHPAIILSFVPGQLNLSPIGGLARAAQLGKALAQLHQAEPRVPNELRRWQLQLSQPAPDGPGIEWARVRRVLTRLPTDGAALIHGDFHMGNALFDGDSLSALLDFTCVRRGPWQFDVGYCRCDLSLLFGLAEADEFSEAYQTTRGRRVEWLAAWDLSGAIKAHPGASAWLPGWIDAGRTDLEPTLVRERLATFVEHALRRA